MIKEQTKWILCIKLDTKAWAQHKPNLRLYSCQFLRTTFLPGQSNRTILFRTVISHKRIASNHSKLIRISRWQSCMQRISLVLLSIELICHQMAIIRPILLTRVCNNHLLTSTPASKSMLKRETRLSKKLMWLQARLYRRKNICKSKASRSLWLDLTNNSSSSCYRSLSRTLVV